MMVVIFALAHFGVLILLAAAAYGIGRRLTWRLAYAGGAEEVAFSLGLGLGCITYLTVILGFVGLLYPWLIAALVGLLQLGCYPVWRDAGRRLRSAATGISPQRLALTLSVILLGIAALAPLWLLPLYPPTAFDAIMYHLATAKIYLEQHQIVFAEYVRFPLFPQTIEVLSALLLGVDDITAQLGQFLLLLLVALALFAWGRRVFSARAGLWAASLWLANPMTIWLGSAGLIDLGLTAFAVLAVYAFSNWLQARAGGWLILAGGFAGLAAGAKYSGLYFLAAGGLVALVVSLRGRQWRAPAIFLGSALVVAAPWYLRNIYYARNPVEPFLPTIFGYHTWIRADYKAQVADWARAGLGHDPLSLLLLPWNLTVNQGVFGNDPLIVPIAFVALPLTLFWTIRRPYIGGLLGAAGAFTLFWFYNAQILRYLLPVLPLLLLATAAALDLTVQVAPRLRRLVPAAAIGVAGFCLVLVPGWAYAVDRLDQQGPVPTMAAERDAYLTARLPAYPAHRLLNQTRGSDYRLYGLYDEDMAYYTDGTFLGNTLGSVRYSGTLDRLKDGSPALYELFRRLNVDYFLVTGFRRDAPLPTDAFFQQHFHLLYSDPVNSVFLYTLTP